MTLTAACAILGGVCILQFVTLVMVVRRGRAQRRLLDALAQETGRKIGQKKTLRLIRQASAASVR